MKSYTIRPIVYGLLLFILSLVSAWAFNTINLQALEHDYPDHVRSGITIATADDISYLIPAENFIENGSWKDNFPGKGAFIQRPPGYGIIYLLFRFAGAGPVMSILLIKWLQLILFALSVTILYKISLLLFGDSLISRFTAAIYGITPFAQGFIFYTITEGITPALLIFAVYLLLRSDGFQGKYFYLSALLFSFIILVRPFLGVFLLFPFLLLMTDQQMKISKTVKKIFIYFFVCLLPLGAWLLRSYNITGEYSGLHPIYYKENNSIFRETHKTIGEFASCWGQRGETFHASMSKLWESGIQDSGQEEAVSFAISKIPHWVIAEITQYKLERAYRIYIASVGDLRNYYLQVKPVPDSLFESEQKAIQSFAELSQQLLQNHFFLCNIIVPVKCYLEMAIHSNLSMYIFQQSWRGNWFTEIIRRIFTGIHAMLFIFLFPAIYISRKNKQVLFLLLSIAVGMIYLAFFQRMVEERYTLPFLPFLLVLVTVEIKSLFRTNL